MARRGSLGCGTIPWRGDSLFFSRGEIFRFLLSVARRFLFSFFSSFRCQYAAYSGCLVPHLPRFPPIGVAGWSHSLSISASPRCLICLGLRSFSPERYRSAVDLRLYGHHPEMRQPKANEASSVKTDFFCLVSPRRLTSPMCDTVSHPPFDKSRNNLTSLTSACFSLVIGNTK